MLSRRPSVSPSREMIIEAGGALFRDDPFACLGGGDVGMVGKPAEFLVAQVGEDGNVPEFFDEVRAHLQIRLPRRTAGFGNWRRAYFSPPFAIGTYSLRYTASQYTQKLVSALDAALQCLVCEDLSIASSSACEWL